MKPLNRFTCNRCGVRYLLKRPLYTRNAEYLRCPECGIAYGTPTGKGTKYAKVWLIRRGILPDAKEMPKL